MIVRKIQKGTYTYKKHKHTQKPYFVYSLLVCSFAQNVLNCKIKSLTRKCQEVYNFPEDLNRDLLYLQFAKLLSVKWKKLIAKIGIKLLLRLGFGVSYDNTNLRTKSAAC